MIAEEVKEQQKENTRTTKVKRILFTIKTERGSARKISMTMVIVQVDKNPQKIYIPAADNYEQQRKNGGTKARNSNREKANIN